MNIIEFDCKNTIDRNNLINLTTTDANFPWFKILNSVPKKENRHVQFVNDANCGIFAHVLQNASEDINLPGKINSYFYHNFNQSFQTICREKDIEPLISYRMCINCTTKFQSNLCETHIDHEFDHYNFIWYMTDTNAATLIYNFDNELIYKSKPKKNRILIFPGYPHAHESPECGENRVVFVCTFGIK